jgi:antitoxin component of MazEF toxin-antitoxin module
MRAPIRKSGRSLAVILPGALLRQAGITDEVEVARHGDCIVLRKPDPRLGWAEATETIAENSAGEHRWPVFLDIDDGTPRW